MTTFNVRRLGFLITAAIAGLAALCFWLTVARAEPLPPAAEVCQFGTTGDDSAKAVDSDGNIYIAGYANGNQPWQTKADVMVRKYDADCNEMWATLLAGDAGKEDIATAIAVHSTGVYVVGHIREHA